MLGKTANELQSNVSISLAGISGTLKYVTGYTEFNTAKPEEQEGNYLALKIEAEPSEGSKTIVELIGGNKGPVELDSDKNVVLLIKNKDTQRVQVTVEKDGEKAIRIYSLNCLTLEQKQ